MPDHPPAGRIPPPGPPAATKATLYRYVWRNNSKRQQLYNRLCRIIATGKMGSICIEFNDGQREIVSRNSVRRLTDQSASLELFDS